MALLHPMQANEMKLGNGSGNIQNQFLYIKKNHWLFIKMFNLNRDQLPSIAWKIPVNTIDSYQGQEKDIIIISNARTVGTGFLNEPKRLNVAMTRARKALIICANFSSIKVRIINFTGHGTINSSFLLCTFQNVRVWEKLLEDAKERQCYHKAKPDITKLLVKPQWQK